MNLEEAYNSFEDKADKAHNQKEKEYINYSKSIATKIESLLINVLSEAKFEEGNYYVVRYEGILRDELDINYIKDIFKYFNTYQDNSFVDKDMSIEFKSDCSYSYRWINFKYKNASIEITPDYAFSVRKYYGKED